MKWLSDRRATVSQSEARARPRAKHCCAVCCSHTQPRTQCRTDRLASRREKCGGQRACRQADRRSLHPATETKPKALPTLEARNLITAVLRDSLACDPAKASRRCCTHDAAICNRCFRIRNDQGQDLGRSAGGIAAARARNLPSSIRTI